MNILVVDDIALNRKLLRAILEAEGHRVLEAGDGIAGLDLLRGEAAVDAVITDILMPYMDGYRFCQELRHDARLMHLPVIMYSATYITPADRKLALDLGADRFIAKPAPAAAILTALAEVTRPGRAVPDAVLHPLPDAELLRQYNARLIEKLEDKAVELERESQKLSQTNAALQKEIQRREQAEERSRGMADLVESSNDAIIAETLDGRVTSWNPAAEQIYGYTAEEMIGRAIAVLLPPDCGCEETDILDRAGRGAERFRFETRRRRKDGIDIDVSLTVSPIRTHDGKIIGASKIARDITTRRQAEQQLADLQADLLRTSRQAGMAEVATSVLHNVGNVLNSVNIASQCLRESLERSKAGNLTKVVTLLNEHATDLPAFLTSDPRGALIPPYLAQLAEHLVVEQARALEELASLQRNIEHIKDAVSRQQDVARVSGAMQSVRPEDLVDDALLMNEGNLARRSIEVRREFGDLPAFTVDRGKVLQILVNLLRNAQQACDLGGRADKRIVVRTRAIAGAIRIAVSDNGCGIAAEHLPRIFSMGFTTKADGHGFGLHSAILAAREMGGSLGVDSDGPGRGATFTLELPVADHPACTEAA